MKKLLLNIFVPDPGSFLAGTILLLIGILIITGGSVGIKVTPESEVHWIEAFGKLDAWIGWLMVWFGIDSIFTRGKATTLILSRTIVPVAEAILKNIIGEEKLNALRNKLEKEANAGSKRD